MGVVESSVLRLSIFPTPSPLIHETRSLLAPQGRTEKFLLEKTRVAFQAQGERNFHVFYR